MEKTINTTVSKFIDNYCGAGCKIEDFRKIEASTIKNMILMLNPDEEDADVMAAAVVEYLTEN